MRSNRQIAYMAHPHMDNKTQSCPHPFTNMTQKYKCRAMGGWVSQFILLIRTQVPILPVEGQYSCTRVFAGRMLSAERHFISTLVGILPALTHRVLLLVMVCPAAWARGHEFVSSIIKCQRTLVCACLLRAFHIVPWYDNFWQFLVQLVDASAGLWKQIVNIVPGY